MIFLTQTQTEFRGKPDIYNTNCYIFCLSDIKLVKTLPILFQLGVANHL